MWLRLFLGTLLVSVIGCSGQPAARVSGRVTLDGEPLAGATVTFVPKASAGNVARGPTASGVTDADGRFTLNFGPKSRGAIVGPNRVVISTLTFEDDADERDVHVKTPERVPARYNSKTELDFDVPAGGTKAANFDLKSQ
jgi:hypothetical protein